MLIKRKVTLHAGSMPQRLIIDCVQSLLGLMLLSINPCGNTISVVHTDGVYYTKLKTTELGTKITRVNIFVATVTKLF